MRNVLRLIGLVGGYWKYIFQGILVSVFLILLQIPSPYFTRLLIDSVFPNQDVSLLGFIVVTQFGLALFGLLLGGVREYYQLNVGLMMGVDVAARFVRHLESMSFRFYDERKTGEIISRLSDAQGAFNSTVALVSSLALSSLQLCVFPIICFAISWKLTLLSLVVYPFDIWVYTLMNRRLFKEGKQVAVSKADLQARLFESLAGIRTVQALGVEEYVEHNITSGLSDLVRKNLSVGRTSFWGSIGSGFLRAVGTLVLGWFGWRYVIDGSITLGQFMAFTMYLGYLSGPIRSLFSLSSSLQQTLVHAERFFEIYDTLPEIRDNEGGTRDLGERIDSIRLECVSFSYDKMRPVLKAVSTEFPVGKMTAIVGRSGSGKTTLVNLLPRFYDCDGGAVTINGMDIKSLSVNELRSRIGYVMQRNSFFGGTILEEISLGKPDAETAAVIDAARKAHIHDYIVSLPEGYHTPVREFASNLSEGQNQRIALARMFLLDKPIVLLDEPTSALDIASEALIRKSLDELRASRTVIVIAHRLNTIESADKVVVLKDGQIIEEGGYSELMLQKGELFRLYRGMARI